MAHSTLASLSVQSQPLDRQRWRFFHSQGTARIGWHALDAAALARAEALAEQVEDDGEIRFRWEFDEAGAADWHCDCGCVPDEVLACILEVRCESCGKWEHAASLWGIGDPSREYQRVVQAELALEALGD